MTDLVAFLRARLDEAAAAPGRDALDDLRFELKRGDPYEQHLSSRIEDGLDHQTRVWEARMAREVQADRKILREHASALAAYKVAQAAQDDDRRIAAAHVLLVWEHVLKIRAAIWSDHPDYDPAWIGGS